MPSFQQRSTKKELLDGDAIPFADIRRNMEELDIINHRLGGHRITIAGMEALTRNHPDKKRWTVAEIGCGGGDNLCAIGRWAQRKGIDIQLTGIDLNPECIAFAKSRPSNKNIHFIHSDYRHARFDEAPDIIFSSLFCHHFTDPALVEMLRWLHKESRTGFFINDLHRHPLAYHSIRLLTQAFSKSYLVKNDAPLSVQRGFVRSDWQKLFESAGIGAYSCQWRWAFRWLIVYNHGTQQPV